MPESTRLIGSIDQIELDFVKQEAAPRSLMKLDTQLYLGECHFEYRFYS